MADEGFKRKLTAILSADVEGYSRLMGDDEEATVRTLKSYREVLATLIQQHNGIVLDSPGDNILAEFVSVVDAVQCAVAVQKEIHARNEELPENRKMQFRIGINLGDVIQEEGRIYGDGVNIAARLESLAEPGGICISKTAFDHIESKLPYGYDFIGEQSVKNIAKPVGAYRVLLDPRVTVSGKPVDGKTSLIRRTPILVGTVVVLVLAFAVGIWQFYLRRPAIEPASVEKMAYPLPDKPSIAVLPFDNMSGDPEQEFFSDGLVEEIITALSSVPEFFVVARNSTFTYKGKPVKVQQISEELGVQYVLEGSVRKSGEKVRVTAQLIAENIITSLSKVGELFVIARNSSFTYKGKPVKVQQISRELGVRYVLEGSVQKSGDRVRVTAQLIDAKNGEHLWAENYDRDLKDIFEIQDEITMKIVTALRIELTEGEQARVSARNIKNIDVHLKAIQANSLWIEGSEKSLMRFGQLAQEIVDAEPESPVGYRMMAWYHKGLGDRGIARQEHYKKAFEFAQKALSMDENDAFSHSVLGYIYLNMREFEKAIASGKRSVELQPNGALVHTIFGSTLCYAEQYDEGITYLKQGLRLNPFPSYYDYFHLGRCYYRKGQYVDALIEAKKALQRAPDAGIVHFSLALIYSVLNREEEARASASKALEILPFISVTMVKNYWRYKTQDGIEVTIDAMRKAGFPE